MKRIAIDPITRIEGHLRIEAQVEHHQVTDAWSSATMFRGLERILLGRDPRDVWLFAQRICGVCTTVHALASVRAVEQAFQITVPRNAQLLRDLIGAAQFVHDHVIHFYHLHSPDWVDLTSALHADPLATSNLQQQLSPWPRNDADYFAQVQKRLRGLADSGRMGIFAQVYWGHPAYRMSPEGNLLMMAHYLEALDWQRQFIRIHALLGGKNPHPQTYLVGGMATPIDPASDVAINHAVIVQLQNLVDIGQQFVAEVYVPDMAYLAANYPEWVQVGAGPGNYMACGEFSGADGTPWMPGGVLLNGDLRTLYAFDPHGIAEDATRAWYTNEQPTNPAYEVLQPRYSGPRPPYELLDVDQKYSWCAAPRYNGMVMEVGPLARLLIADAHGHPQVRKLLDRSYGGVSLRATPYGSTITRMLARALETQLLSEQLSVWLEALDTNIAAGDLTIFNGERWDPASWPAEARGGGLVEAPRGVLGHWIGIEHGTVAHYQAVVPSTWNGSPRDAAGQRGVWEQALLGIPLADAARPIEVLRTIHAFDPCMACAVHIVDAQGTPGLRVETI